MSKTRTKLDILDEYVSIDVETTGLDRHWCEIIEVAAVRMINGKEVDVFSSLIRPRDPEIPEFIEELTGISSKELIDAPIPSDVIPSFITFIGDAPIVGHNVCFDADFISDAAETVGISFAPSVLVDGMRISKHVFGMKVKHRLPAVVERCGNLSIDGTAHRALYDARAAAFCYENMKPMLIEKYGENPDLGYQKLSRKNRTKQSFDGMKPTVEEFDEANPFYGASVCFTGKLDSMTRRDAWQMALNVGANPIEGVTKKLDYLVVGSFDFNASLKGKPSSKLLKARKYAEEGIEVQICSEDFFREYVE